MSSAHYVLVLTRVKMEWRGLDVGARTPSESAISILAEVIAVRTDRTGESPREASGPIHPEGAPETTSGS